ncbi:hypothetical protein BS17DRAFT_773271, partial [Gyrodon lividus]
MQTRSTLKKTHDAEKTTPPLQHETSDDEIELARAKPTQGKHSQATESYKRRRRRGRLEMLPELNLDVLFQVLSFLHPMDLLNLARSAKAFRQLLMRKSFAFAWKTARGQVEGPPDCPPDLSEPQYANLAFYPHCHNCGNVVPTIHWRLRRRYCPLQLRKGCVHPMNDGGLPEETLKVNESLGNKFAGNKFPYVDIKQLGAFMEEYKKVPLDTRDEFRANKRLQVCAINKHASECEAWHQHITDARKFELQNARIARAESIFARLEGLGYEAEINYHGTGYIEGFQPSTFNKARSTEWDSIYPQLEEAVYNPRRKLLVELYDAYVRQPAPEGAAVDLFPSIADLVHFAAFDTIIKLPEETNIPALVQDWRANVDAQLAALVIIPAESSTSGVSTDDVGDQKLTPGDRLRLAGAVFQVRTSSDPMMYPDILDLPVFNSCYCSSIAFREIRGQPWSVMDGGAVVELFTGAAHVVRACGMDPQTATVEDMDQRNARLMCNHCFDTHPKVWTWRSAIRHVKFHNTSWQWKQDPQRQQTQWSLVDDCHISNIQAVEQPPINPRPDVKVDCTLCQKQMGALCQKWVGDTLAPLDVRAHLRSNYISCRHHMTVN